MHAARSPREIFWAPKHFVGWITPSANTVVERVTLGILSEFPEVSPHFSRTSVVGAVDPYPLTYDFDDMLATARVLGDARLDVVAWNGSKGGSLDFALDRDLVARIEALTDAKSTTSTLAIEQVFQQDGITRFGLACPYVDAYRERIVRTFAREGYECVAARNAGLADNYSFSQIPPDRMVAMLRDVAAAKPQAIITFCTNFPAAPLVAEMEEELGIPIYDTVTMGVWGALNLLGIDTRAGRAWGRVFER
ncbi:MAG: maleate cis-trans isomerase family protein [Cupriavidus necator]